MSHPLRLASPLLAPLPVSRTATTTVAIPARAHTHRKDAA
jgi:hypothetical protein